MNENSRDTHVEDLYARNWAFISPDLQRKLGTVRILFAGTGLGSMIARAAVQTGFQRLILADGDVVERTNLNRQDFTGAQLGQNKAQALADTLRSIQPRAEIEVTPRYLTSADFPSLVAHCDLIVNTIDLDNPAFLALSRTAHEQGKYSLFPMNLGWGGSVLIFSPEGMSLDAYLATDHPDDDPESAITALIARVVKSLPGGVPLELAPVLRQFVERTASTWPYDPQLGIAAHLTAALCARAAVALVAGHPVRVAPEVIWLNASDALAPALAPDWPRETEVVTGVDSRPNLAGEHSALRPFSRTHVQQRLEAQGTGTRAGYTVVSREGTGLTVITARQGALTPQERREISQYRLEQYALAGLYDANLIAQQHLAEDPSMALLSDQDTHIVVADMDGVIASYLCLQGASAEMRPLVDTSTSSEAAASIGAVVQPLRRPANSTFPWMADLARNGFPVETEYGDIYAQHPWVRLIHAENVREITRFVRNLALKQTSPASFVDLATVETILAAVRYVTDPSNRIEAIIGCMAPEARRFLRNLNIPIAYAPDAPILGDNLGGEGADGLLVWASGSHEPGKFWPFALSCTELQRDLAYFSKLEEALSSADPQLARQSMNAIRRLHPYRQSRFATHHTEQQAIAWVDLDE